MRSIEEIGSDVDAAILHHNAAALYRLAEEMDAVGTNASHAEAARARGLACLFAGDRPTALEQLSLALERYTELGDKRGRAKTTVNIGNVYLNTGSYQNALDHFQRALTLYEELDNTLGIAVAVGNIGSVYHATGNYSEALEHHQRALTLYESLGDSNGIARAATNIGTVYQDKGDYTRALELFHLALSQYEKLDIKHYIATLTSKIGLVHDNVGDFSTALDHYRRALSLYEELGLKHGIALVLGNIGVVYAKTDDYPKALEYFSRTITIHEELGAKYGIAVMRGNLGNIYTNTGNFPEALDQHHRALALYEQLGDRSGLAIVYDSIGTVHFQTDNYDAAFEYYNHALSIYTEIGEQSSIARVTVNIGNAHSKKGHYHEALETYRHALMLFEGLGERIGKARASASIIQTLIVLERHPEAEELLSKLDSMEIDEPSVVILRERSRAMLLEHHGAYDDAVHTLKTVLILAQEHGLAAEQVDLHKGLRDLAQVRNDFAAYIEHNTKYQNIADEINGKATSRKIAVMEADRQIEAERAEKEKHRALLYNTLPPAIADRVLQGEQVNDSFERATVMFMDLVGFTTMSSTMSADAVVQLLSQIYSACDEIISENNLMKIKTIGDSYMSVSFPYSDVDDDCEGRAAKAACDMMNMMRERFPEITVRIGIHCGPVTAGVIGTQRLQYDVWGDTVNVASRMESTGEPGRIHVSEAFASHLSLRLRNDSSSLASDEANDDNPSASEKTGTWHLALRGETELKGKGTMTTYWLGRV